MSLQSSKELPGLRTTTTRTNWIRSQQLFQPFVVSIPVEQRVYCISGLELTFNCCRKDTRRFAGFVSFWPLQIRPHVVWIPLTSWWSCHWQLSVCLIQGITEMFIRSCIPISHIAKLCNDLTRMGHEVRPHCKHPRIALIFKQCYHFLTRI